MASEIACQLADDFIISVWHDFKYILLAHLLYITLPFNPNWSLGFFCVVRQREIL